jgi:hypothetical protein
MAVVGFLSTDSAIVSMNRAERAAIITLVEAFAKRFLELAVRGVRYVRRRNVIFISVAPTALSTVLSHPSRSYV